jgi:hypothetical protein
MSTRHLRRRVHSGTTVLPGAPGALASFSAYGPQVNSLQPQFRTDKWTFLLDGRVVEWFYEGTSDSTRVHVDRLRIDAEPEGNNLKIRWGIEVSGSIINGGQLVVPAAQIGEFKAFVALAIANRTPGYHS